MPTWILIGFGDHGGRTVLPALHAVRETDLLIIDKEPDRFTQCRLGLLWKRVEKRRSNRFYDKQQFMDFVINARVQDPPATPEKVQELLRSRRRQGRLIGYFATAPDAYPDLIRLYGPHCSEIILEKPLANSAEGFAKITECISQSIKTQRGSVLRYIDHYTYKFVVRNMENARSSAIGRAMLRNANVVELWMVEQSGVEGRPDFFTAQERLNALWDMGVHLLALLEHLFGVFHCLEVHEIVCGSYDNLYYATYCYLEGTILSGTRSPKHVFLMCGKGLPADRKQVVLRDERYRLELDILDECITLQTYSARKETAPLTFTSTCDREDTLYSSDAYENFFSQVRNDEDGGEDYQRVLEAGLRNTDSILRLEKKRRFVKPHARGEWPEVFRGLESASRARLREAREPFVVLDTFGVFFDTRDYLMQKFTALRKYFHEVTGASISIRRVSSAIDKGVNDEWEILAQVRARVRGEKNLCLVDDWWERSWPEFGPKLLECRVRREVREFVHWLRFSRAQSILLSFVPVKDLRLAARKIEETHDVANLFDRVYGRSASWDDAKKAKGVGESLEEIAARMVFLPERWGVLVDDADENITAARAKKYRCVCAKEYFGDEGRGSGATLGEWLVERVEAQLVA